MSVLRAISACRFLALFGSEVITRVAIPEHRRPHPSPHLDVVGLVVTTDVSRLSQRRDALGNVLVPMFAPVSLGTR
jgi:hypothetical protein